MFGEENNLKDAADNLGIAVKDSKFSISYTRVNKLITALYMVTDIIDREEPLRNKLRTLGTGIISDTNSAPLNACAKISEIMSFLDIAFAVNIISEMNCNILRKEFEGLNQSIKESIGKFEVVNRQINLAEFLGEDSSGSLLIRSKENYKSIGHLPSNSIGVQKGSTLMKALGRVKVSDINLPKKHINDFEALKKQRRADIINVIKISGGTATIKDIKDKIQLGEKTLQRELISMVKDNVLKKTGEKRWSRYFVRN
jgi:hypothetical protein